MEIWQVVLLFYCAIICSIILIVWIIRRGV
jgi:hypothetical protein